MIESGQDRLFFKIKGVSMKPFFKTGDMFIVKKVDVRELRIGDIISYYSQFHKEDVCHRLVKIVRREAGVELTARADAYTEASEPVDEKNLTGKVVGVIRNGRLADFSTWRHIFFNRCVVLWLPVYVRIANRIKRACR